MKMKLLFYLIVSLASFTVFAANTAEEELKHKIAATFAELDAKNNYSEMLTYSDLNSLPLGLKKTVGNNEFTVAVSNARYFDNYAELTLFARMWISQKSEPIFFAASGVRLSYKGNFLGDAILSLLGEIEIPITNDYKIIMHGGEYNPNSGTIDNRSTYLSVDCSGFRDLSLNASLIFKETFIKRAKGKGAVSADFSVTVANWDNLLVELSLPAFKIEGLDGFTFQLSDIVFDYSDFVNSLNMKFPSGYKNKYLSGISEELWRGIYAKKVKITIPEELSGDGKSMSFSADHLLIDDNGISGKFSGENILSINEGSASGWRFSIDKFNLEMEAHKITKGGFAGLIGLPVSEEGTLLGYEAKIMGNNNYQMTVAMKDTIDFDMLMGKAVLKPNSSISLKWKDGKLTPEANLHGYLTIKTSLTGTSGNENAVLSDIEFRDLCFKTENPYISVGYMGYKGEIKILNYPVSLSDIEASAKSNKFNIGFNLNMNLDQKFISASARFNISSVYVENKKHSHWKMEAVGLSEITLDKNEIAGVIEVGGKLRIMEDNPVYGDGFYGDINLKFNKIINNLDISVASAFGNKNGDRYWFTDGAIELPKAVPVVGIVGIKGFVGGASMGMRRSFNSGIGQTPSGCGFIPDANVGLGLKAGVILSSTGSDSFSGDASFEMIFNRSGGINTVGFYGFVAFVSKIPEFDNVVGNLSSLLKNYVDKENELVQGSLARMEELEKMKNDNPTKATEQITDSKTKISKANIGATLGMLYTVSDNTLHANFDFYVNAAGGALRGTASDNRAGWAVLHFSPEKWYVHLGAPSDRNGIALGIPGIATINTSSYFMLGDEMPEAPAPPSKITDLIGEGNYNCMRDMNLLKSGKGMAFGSSFGFSTGDLTCLMLYARFDMEAGFDLMIKDYGDAQCKGGTGQIGMDGWYANGQSYFYLNGELGVKVNLLFVKGRFPIISGGTAALLQTKLPNPTWIGGAMGVKFNILGGLVKGSTSFKFSFGDECQIVLPGSSPVDIAMISDLSPSTNAADIDVFTAPQVALTYPAQQPFTFNEDGETKTYRINLDKFEIIDDNKVIPAEVRWNEENTAATLYSHETLPPFKTLRLSVAVGFEEKVNEQWKTVTASGEKSLETREISFTTGDAPDYIPLTNIEYAYPLVDQQYYYPNEFKEGFIQLHRGQSYLFPSNWNYFVTINDGNNLQQQKFTYDPANKRVNFQIPELTRSRNYNIVFSTSTLSKSVNNSETIKETVLYSDDENYVVQSSSFANTAIKENSEKQLLTYHFASSKYKLFADKMKNISKGQVMTLFDGPYIVGIGYGGTTTDEIFCEAEIFGTENSGKKPLISATAVLNGNAFYEKHIYPLVYNNYPPKGIGLAREGDEAGIPPVSAFGKWKEEGKFPIRYEVPKYFYHDYGELRAKLVNAGVVDHPLVISTGYTDILSGKYPAVLQYTLPDGKKGSSITFDYQIQK
jgi:hypothetical protein